MQTFINTLITIPVGCNYCNRQFECLLMKFLLFSHPEQSRRTILFPILREKITRPETSGD